MEKIGFEDAVERISNRDPRFHRDAYYFLREALDHTVKILTRDSIGDPGRHVSGPELLDGFRELSLNQFGPMAVTVFEQWGISRCSDVGDMVFNLIHEGAFGQSETDRPEDFHGGYDFHEAFVAPFLPRDRDRRVPSTAHA